MEAEKGQLEVNSERNAQEMKDRSVSLGEILIGDPLSGNLYIIKYILTKNRQIT